MSQRFDETKLWCKCACGWAGLPSELKLGPYDRVCPRCGGSGGLLVVGTGSGVAEQSQAK